MCRNLSGGGPCYGWGEYSGNKECARLCNCSRSDGEGYWEIMIEKQKAKQAGG